MLFDFDTFKDIAKSVYPDTAYSFGEAILVFRYFFKKYEEATGEPHPAINTNQIVWICKEMPRIKNCYGGEIELSADEYMGLIDRYFRTPFKNCDYRINHFFSGRVREMRYYEMMSDED